MGRLSGRLRCRFIDRLSGRLQDKEICDVEKISYHELMSDECFWYVILKAGRGQRITCSEGCDVGCLVGCEEGMREG